MWHMLLWFSLEVTQWWSEVNEELWSSLASWWNIMSKFWASLFSLAGGALRVWCYTHTQLSLGRAIPAIPKCLPCDAGAISLLPVWAMCASRAVVLDGLSCPTQQRCPPLGQQLLLGPWLKPKHPLRKHALGSSATELMKCFPFNSREWPCSSMKLAFCFFQVLQVPVGSGIASVWACCSYKLSGCCRTSGSFDNSWWGNRFHFVMIL